MSLSKVLPKIKENVVLAPYTTFKIGGPARYFFILENIDELFPVLNWAEKKRLPVFIIAGGSNLLVSDRGYNGLVILMKLNQLKMNKNRLIVEAGVPLAQVLKFCLKNELSGLEWAAGIPGTIGGAVVDNAGAFGESISDLVEKVKTFYLKKNKGYFKMLRKKDLKFSYRRSVFKRPGNKYIITEIWLKGLGKLTEKDKQLVIERLKRRKDKQPQLPSAGCVFKNFTPHPIRASNIHQYSRVKIKTSRFGLGAGLAPIPAGKLIEECGLKGKRVGGAEISEKHANFIVNCGRAKAEDVIKLIRLIKKEVKKKFRIDLQEEILYLGSDPINVPSKTRISKRL